MLRRILPAVTVLVAALGIATPAQAVSTMPAIDGEPMLWPAAITVTQAGEDGRPVSATRYGFVDTTAELAVPADYASYSYCADGDGRPAAVLASGADGSDVLDFSGQLVGRFDARHAVCVGSSHLIAIEFVDGRWRTTVIEIATGERVLTVSPDQRVTAIASGMVNVTGADGEHYVDLARGIEIPHPGWVTVASLEGGAPGVPAAERRVDGRPAGKLGYLGRTGQWLIAPELDAASPFRGGYAVVKQDGRSTFLDVGLRRVGGEWEQIRPVTVPAASGERVVGYWVEADGRRGLLGPDLQTVVQPGPGAIDCEPQAGGACVLVASDGRADLVRLPQGGAQALPDGFTRVLNSGLVADRATPDRSSTTRIRSLGSGRTVSVPGSAVCHGVGQLFVSCSGSVVIDAHGERTEFDSVSAIPDPAGGTAYYWVTTEREQGFLDRDGRWRYRQPRTS